MTINDRVKSVRLSVGLNQTEFGERITVAQTYLSQIEKGDRDVTKKILKLICLQFNVNEEWLRTGNGSMFVESDASLVGQLAEKYGLGGVEQTILASFLGLNEKNRAVVLDFFKSAVARVIENNYEEIRPYFTDEPTQAAARHGGEINGDELSSLVDKIALMRYYNITNAVCVETTTQEGTTDGKGKDVQPRNTQGNGQRAVGKRRNHC